MISHLSLKTTKSLSTSVKMATDDNGFEFLVINHPKLNAAFSLHGGHLLHFQATGEAPAIWLSKTAVFDGKKAIRGGVPICWPWFGAASPTLGENLPSHGFARTSKWSVGNIEESSEGVKLELQLFSCEKTLALWPHEFKLTLKAMLSEHLTLQLVTENKSEKPLTYHGALHTYLNISAPESITISGLNTQFCNLLNNKALETGDSTLLVDKASDTIYQKAPGDIVLVDKQFQRTLSMTNSGNDCEVLWSPWIKGAQAFTDMPDDGYQTMFCIESAITRNAGQQVKSGQIHSLSTIIK